MAVRKYSLLCCLFVVLFSIQTVQSSYADKIKNVIVLMLENRSFDHMLGMLKKTRPDVNGCLPDQDGCSNHLDPADASSAKITVNDAAVYQQADPSHSVDGTSQQIYGTPDTNAVANMDGFIASYLGKDDADGATIMNCFAPEHVPAITTLANEYAMFDGYFASIPGPTEPNRCYAMAASSHGMCTNDINLMVRGMPQTTIFRQVEEMGLDYSIYMEQVPTAIMFKDVRHKDARKRYHFMDKFYEDAAAGTLPDYSWLEPSYFDVPETGRYAADQHPAHDVSVGDELIKKIYESIRASPQWNTTAFIITYDEHGGFFDHVTPPENIPNPDDMNCEESNGGFNFDRQGVRVPFVVVSPWVEKGKLVHAQSSNEGQYEHSSIPATVIHKLLEPAEDFPQPGYLTKRDAWAATFETVFDDLDAPRTDCIETLPEIASHRVLFPASLPNISGIATMSDLQQNIVLMMAGAVEDTAVTDNVASLAEWSEAQGGVYVVEKMKQFMNSGEE